MPDFGLFLSYRRSDSPAFQPLLDALGDRGLRMWRDKDEIEDFVSNPKAIHDGLAKARALLVWYSPDCPRTRACPWEFIAAAYLAAQAEGDPRRPLQSALPGAPRPDPTTAPRRGREPLVEGPSRPRCLLTEAGAGYRPAM